MNTLKEFVQFLRETNIISLAVAFVMGAASTNLTKSLVNDIVMPIVEPLMAADNWREAVLQVGPVSIAYGSFLAELSNFVILALVVFVVVRKLLKLDLAKR